MLLNVGIGVAVNLKARIRDHIRSAPWRAEIRRVAVEWYDSWPGAKAAETKAISDEKPRYNIAENEWNEWNEQISTHPAAARRRGIRLTQNGLPPKQVITYSYEVAESRPPNSGTTEETSTAT